MARKPKQLHELTLKNHNGRAVVWYGGREQVFGAWDKDNDKPSDDAMSRFMAQVELWKTQPNSGLIAAGELFFIELWELWVKSGQTIGSPRRERERVQELLFGLPGEDGPHLYTTSSGFTLPVFSDWQDYLCSLKSPKDPTKTRFNRGTVLKFIAQIKACFQWAAQKGKVKYEHFASLKLLAAPRKGSVREMTKRKGVLWKSVESVLPKLSPPLRAATELLWLTCARPSEMLNLRVSDIVRSGEILPPSGMPIDLDKYGVWAALIESHKTHDKGFDRVIFFGRRSQEILSRLMEGHNGDEFVFRPVDGTVWRTGNSDVSLTGMRRPGEFYDYHALTRAVSRVCKKLKIPVFSPYQLRHAAFKNVQSRYGRDAARAFGGHKVGGATEDYAGVDLSTAARIASEMG